MLISIYMLVTCWLQKKTENVFLSQFNSQGLNFPTSLDKIMMLTAFQILNQVNIA